MSMPLFKATLKQNWIIFIIFLAILLMYMSIMISMYDPEDIAAITQFYETLPRAMLDAFAFDAPIINMITFIATYFYGFLVLMFPLIYCIILANRLVAAHVDRGSMAYLLATPNSRPKIIFTQAVYMALSVIVLLTLTAASGTAISEALFPGELDIAAFIKINMAAILLTLAVSSICFFFSCLFNETKHSLAVGGGVPVLFFVINMLRNISDNFSWLEYLTIYSLFNPRALATGEESLLIPGLIFAAITLTLYAGGTFIFSRRNLYL